MAQVKELATITGWMCYHTRDSRRSDPGFPDLALTRNGRAVFTELKVKGKLTLPQRLWLWNLAWAGNEVFLWKEGESWRQIERTLR